MLQEELENWNSTARRYKGIQNLASLLHDSISNDLRGKTTLIIDNKLHARFAKMNKIELFACSFCSDNYSCAECLLKFRLGKGCNEADSEWYQIKSKSHMLRNFIGSFVWLINDSKKVCERVLIEVELLLIESQSLGLRERVSVKYDYPIYRRVDK